MEQRYEWCVHLPRPEDCGLTERERGLLDAVMTRLHEIAL